MKNTCILGNKVVIDYIKLSQYHYIYVFPGCRWVKIIDVVNIIVSGACGDSALYCRYEHKYDIQFFKHWIHFKLF